MSDDDVIEVKVVWSDAENLPVYRANTFFAQNEYDVDGKPNGIVLTIGNISPPMVMGTPEEMDAVLRSLGAVSPKGLGRYSMGLGNAKQLVQFLTAQITQIEGGNGS